MSAVIRDQAGSKAPYAKCLICPLYKEQAVYGTGPALAEIAIVGEGPGWEELRRGTPFVGPSGQLLNSALAAAGLRRDQVWITNATLCSPFALGSSKDAYIGQAAGCCANRLLAELKQRGVQKVLAVGAFASKALGAPPEFSITRDRGRRWTFHGMEIMPTPHPAYLLRQIEEMGKGQLIYTLVNDLRKLRRTKRPIPDVKYTVLDSTAQVFYYLVALKQRLADENPLLVSIDLETDGLMPKYSRIISFGLAYEDNHVGIIPEKILYRPEVIEQLRRVLTLSGIELAAHNAKFERAFIKAQLGIDLTFDYDTLLLHVLLDETPGTHGLKDIVSEEWETDDYSKELDQVLANAQASRDSRLTAAKQVVRQSKTKKWAGFHTPAKVAEAEKLVAELDGKDVNFGDVPEHILYPYQAKDIIYTRMLVDILAARAEKTDPDLLAYFFKFLMPVQNLIADMELEGFVFDTEYRTKLGGTDSDAPLEQRGEVGKRAAQLLSDLKAQTWTEFNPGSSKDLVRYLYQMKRYPVPKMTEGGAPGTDEFCLQTIQRGLGDRPDPVIIGVLRYKKLIKLLGTYIWGNDVMVQPDGRVRPSINLVGTVTGRPSCSRPNLMNLPRPDDDPDMPNIRKLYRAPSGHKVVTVDFSQCEVRILARLSQDPFLVSAFQKDEDIHVNVTKFIFGDDYQSLPNAKALRTVGKTANFSGVYNKFSAYSIAHLLEKRGILMPLPQIEKFMEDYKRLVPRLVDYMNRVIADLHRQGYVKLFYGNRRRFGLTRGRHADKIEKEAINATAQGPACQTTWLAMLEVDKLRKTLPYRVEMPMMVYDSIVCCVPAEHAEWFGNEVAKIMVETARRELGDLVPFKADVSIGDSWGDK